MSLTGHILTQVGGTVLVIGAAYGAGWPWLRRFPFRSRFEALLWTVALGLGLSGTTGFLLALVGLLYRSVWWAYTGVWGAVGLIAGIRLMRPGSPVGPGAPVSRRRGIQAGYGLLGLLLAALYVKTLYPPTHWDATAYHLVLARETLQRHHLPVIPDLAVPLLPVLHHMLFTWAMALKGDTLAQAVEWVSLGLVTGVLGTWGRWPVLDLALAVLWTATPIVMVLGPSAYVDVGATAFAFLGLAAFARWEERGDGGWLSLGMALLAMAAGTKMNVLPWWALGLLWVAWTGIRRGMAPRHWAQVVALGIGLGAPWYAWIAYHTGNPLWPAWPGGREPWRAAALWFQTYWRQIAGVPGDFGSFLQIPWIAVSQPARLYAEAPFSPLTPLLWVTPIVAIADRSTRRWTLWAWYFVGTWFLSHRQLRHLVPVIPVLHRAVGEALGWSADRWRVWNRVATGVAWGAIAIGVGSGLSGTLRDLRHWGVPPSTAEERDAFLRRMYAGYTGVEFINHRAGPSDRVYLLSGSYLRYYLRPAVTDPHSMVGNQVVAKYTEPGQPTTLSDRWTEWLLAQGFEWVLVGPTPGRWDIPLSNPFWRHYRLVHLQPGVWVFRREPRPLEVTFVPLGAADGTCHSISLDRPLLQSLPVRPEVLLVRFQARGTDFHRFRWEWEGDGWGGGSQSVQLRSQAQSYFFLLPGPPRPTVGRFRWRFETYPPLMPRELEVCDTRIYSVEMSDPGPARASGALPAYLPMLERPSFSRGPKG
ncbi:hypothetical protein HRbin11_02333 [bacterium HR11]|nr:hypothetical protein HRbin11_02333 [bacterium HR11]